MRKKSQLLSIQRNKLLPCQKKVNYIMQFKNDICPFCGGHIDNHGESYDVAIQAETKRSVSELAVIAAAENSVR